MNIFRPCLTFISKAIPLCGRIDESPRQSSSSQSTPHAPTADQSTLHQQPLRPTSQRDSESSRLQLYAKIKAGTGTGESRKSWINNFRDLSGEDFFKEVIALFDLSKDVKVGNADRVHKTELVDAFLQHFEDKAKAFASEFAKSDVAEFNTPITTLRRLMPIFNPGNIKDGDAILNRLIQTIPEYARPVPKRAFCIWEGREISQESLDNLAKFMQLNPDYTLTLLTSNPKSAIKALMKRSDGNWLMNRLKVKSQNYSDAPLVEGAINRENSGPYANYASGSDIARMYALVKKDENGESGGLYFDVDCKFHKPLPQLLAPLGIQTLWVPGVFYNGIMAAPPGSEILQQALIDTVKQYDERNKGSWSADIWINKRAGILAPKDEEGAELKKDKGKTKKPQRESYNDELLRNIAYFEKAEHTEWTAALRESHKDLLENPREELTAQTTVKPLLDIMLRDFGPSCMDYCKSLNGFADLLGQANTFELPCDMGWAKSNAGKRRASIAW